VEIGRYRVTAVLGTGATGMVYRATDGNEAVAIKVLRAPDAEAQRRFTREAKLAAQVVSRHVVPVLDVGPGYLVMPLYESTLAAAIRSRGALRLPETIELAAQIARGLDALHAGGVLHRDVKPSNVLIAGDGTAALSDFGIARGPDSTQLTRDGQLLGTPQYLAPELIEGAAASTASDIYAFGCVLYECLTGLTPFGGRAASEIGYAHLVERPPDPRAHRPELPAAVTPALLSALEKQPSARPTTATALARMLHLAGTPAPA
jgi:eukaryotic-like serine/threonine-protein kinase